MDFKSTFYEVAKTIQPDFILGVVAIFLMLLNICCFYTSKRRLEKQKAVAIIMIGLYLFLLFTITVFGRDKQDQLQYHFIPCWSYVAVLTGKSISLRYEIPLNILLFIPIGFFPAVISIGKEKRLQKIICSGICLSLSIELLQLFTRCGAFDIDDLIDNAIGALIGYEIYHFIEKIFINAKDKKDERIEMEIQEQNFLTILKCIVAEIQERKAEQCSLQNPDWNAIFTLAQSHNLLSLVYSYVLEHELYQCAGMDDYFIRAAKLVSEQMGKTYDFLKLYSVLKNKGLTPIVMKGIICRSLYGAHENERPSGDEDILIKKTDFIPLREVFEEQGFRCVREEISQQQLDELQEIDFLGNNLHVEVHVNAMGKLNPVWEKLNRYVDNDTIISRSVDFAAKDEEGNTIVLRTMRPTDHLTYLVLHAWRHFTSCGLGIRQIMDILLYRDAYANQINTEEFVEVLNGSGTLQFYNDLEVIGSEYLGFEQKIKASDNAFTQRDAARREALLQDIISCGVFGIETEAQCVANSYTNAALTTGRQKNNLLKTIFPGMKQMESRFPILLKRPYLLPFYWIYRIIVFIRDHKSAGKLAQESVAISQRRLKLLSQYGVVE